MNCKETQYEIISSKPLSQEAEMHLLECSDCQAFAVVHNAALHKAPAPSPELDAAVLAEFRRQNAGLTSKRMRFFTRACSAIVASLLIVLSIYSAKMLSNSRGISNTVFSSNFDEYLLAYLAATDEMDELEECLDTLSVIATTPGEPHVQAHDVRVLDDDLTSLEVDMFYEL